MQRLPQHGNDSLFALFHTPRLCDCHITVIMAVTTSQTRGPRTKSPGASRLPEYESVPLPQRITETRWTATMRPDGPRGYSGDKPEVTKVVR